MNEQKTIFAAVAAVVLMALLAFGAFTAGWRAAERNCPPLPDTITIRHTDTVTVTAPPDTVTLTKWKLKAVHDTAIIVIHDTIFVLLAYEQHHFSKPDTLDVWYSGVDAKIDSLRMFHHTTTIIERQIVNDMRRNFIGASVGFNDASVAYMRRIGNVWLGVAAGSTYQGQPTAKIVGGYSFK